MSTKDSKRILQLARNTLSVDEQLLGGMDISELSGKDTEAAKREANRKMVANGDCYELREAQKVGRKPKFY